MPSVVGSTGDGGTGFVVMGHDEIVLSDNGNELGSGFSGVILKADPFEYPAASGNTWSILGINSDTLQFGASATDGKLYAGAGAVILDNNGIRIHAGGASANSIVWQDLSPTIDVMAMGAAATTGATPNRSTTGNLYAQNEIGGTGDSVLNVYAQGASGIMGITFDTLSAQGGAGAGISYTDLSGPQTGTMARGFMSKAVSLSMTTSEQAIITRTIKGNSLNIKGWLISEALSIYLNNSSGSRTFTVTYNFGSYAFAIVLTRTASATSRHVLRILVHTLNNQATNAQAHGLVVIDQPTNNPIATATLTTGIAEVAWDTSAIDTTADITASITVKSSAATATQTTVGAGRMDGPYIGT